MASLESRITQLERAANPSRGCVTAPLFEGETEEEALREAGLSREDADAYDLVVFVRHFRVRRDGREVPRDTPMS
jgi:hypothetical protein